MPKPFSSGRDSTQANFTSIPETAPQYAATLTGELSAYGRLLLAPSGVSFAALTAGTATTILPDADVGPSRKLWLEGTRIKVNGATAWTGGTLTVVTIQDSAGNKFMDIAVAALTANAYITTATAGVTLYPAYTLGLPITGGGAAAGKGLQVIADGNAGAGSPLVITAFIGVSPVSKP